MSTNVILTQKNGKSQQFDKAFISKSELDSLVERVLFINSKVIEFKTTYEKLGEELALTQSHLKTYQSWLDLTLKEAGK